MLIEQISEFEWRGQEPLDRTCTLTTGYFHVKKNLEGKSSSGLLFRTKIPVVESRTQGSRPRPRPRTQKKIRGQGQGQPFEDRHSRGQGQECSRPRPRTKDTKRKCSPKKKKKKVFTKIFQAISTKKRFPKNFSSAPQNFNIPKNSAVLEPRTGQFSRT